MERPIAYLTGVYARAGDTFIRREVEELRRRGWTVHTFSIRRTDERENVSEDILREQRTTDFILERGFWRLLGAFARMSLRAPGRMLDAIRLARGMRWRGVKGWLWHWFYLVEASYLAEQLIARDVALLHNHIATNSATVALLASALSGVPFSLTIHGPHDFFAADHWALGKKIAASALTVCVSDFGRSQCMLFTPLEHWHKLHVVRCGVDREFLEDTSSVKRRPSRLISVGRLSPEKGHLVLVRAIAMLRDQGLTPEVVLIGDGPSRADIEREARELGVAGQIRLVGWKASSDLHRWILESRAMVLPSFAEGVPVVLMEAMALRRPVIATYVGGVPELVHSGDDGWLVPAGSVEELAKAMREVLVAPLSQLDRMGDRGRQQVLERHSVPIEVGKLADLLEEAIRTAGRGPEHRAT